MPQAKKTDSAAIELRQLEYGRIIVPVTGVTPVIPHRWTEKSLKMMRDKQMSEAGTLGKRREPKNPDEEAEQATYWLPMLDEHGKPVLDQDGNPQRYGAIPAVSFKASLVAAVRDFEGLTMIETKTMMHVRGDGPEQLVRLVKPGTDLPADYDMREDTPRNSGGTADLRYRNAFWPWAAELDIKFKVSRITEASIISLVDAAGTNGVGDWRPNSPKSSTGTFGQFTLDDSRPVERIEYRAAS